MGLMENYNKPITFKNISEVKKREIEQGQRSNRLNISLQKLMQRKRRWKTVRAGCEENMAISLELLV